jgi:uncharacterized protein YndB with AHSA1/START domain
MKRDLRLERVYPHPPERVWRAIAEREGLAAWLMANDFEPRVGHKFTFHAKPVPGWNGITYCEVTELVPLERIAFTWRGGETGKPATLDTLVRFSLEPTEGGTRLVLEHNGFEGFKAVAVSFMMRSGWVKMMRGRLPSHLDALARTAASVPLSATPV